jgi:NitT/TauT family transport system ATP-binding protein
MDISGTEKKRKNWTVRKYLRMLGLESVSGYYPHQLSTGMKQKVAFARSLAVNPRVLLMDEPFSSIDQNAKKQYRRELVRLWKKTHVTMVFVTHDIEEAQALATRIVVMGKNGTIKESIILESSYTDKKKARASNSKIHKRILEALQ